MTPVSRSYDNEAIVSVRDLRFTYDGGVEALRGITLDIQMGDYVAIVGGNGSGKTTLAKHMNGLLRPTEGSVRVAGRLADEMTVAELSRIVGYAFQNPDHQLFCSSVEEEVSFGPRNIGCSADEVERRTERALSTMGLQGLRSLPPLSLNLGQRRRVSIASVIAMDPKVLILDEPTTGLDTSETRDLMESIGALNEEGRTIILITHEMKIVAEHAERVVVMADGKVMLDGDVRSSFGDIALLRQSKLLPPPVTMLAHRLARFGVSRSALSVDEFVTDVVRILEGRR